MYLRERECPHEWGQEGGVSAEGEADSADRLTQAGSQNPGIMT